MKKDLTDEEKTFAHVEKKRKMRENYAKHKEYYKEIGREKYHNNPAYKEQKRLANLKKYSDPVFRQRKLQLAKEKKDSINEIVLKFHAQSL